MQISPTTSYTVSLTKQESESIVYSLNQVLPILLKDPAKHQSIVEFSNYLLLALNTQEHSHEV